MHPTRFDGRKIGDDARAIALFMRLLRIRFRMVERSRFRAFAALLLPANRGLGRHEEIFARGRGP
jgi:hypothetical protein